MSYLRKACSSCLFAICVHSALSHMQTPQSGGGGYFPGTDTFCSDTMCFWKLPPTVALLPQSLQVTGSQRGVEDWGTFMVVSMTGKPPRGQRCRHSATSEVTKKNCPMSHRTMESRQVWVQWKILLTVFWDWSLPMFYVQTQNTSCTVSMCTELSNKKTENCGKTDFVFCQNVSQSWSPFPKIISWYLNHP